MLRKTTLALAIGMAWASLPAAVSAQTSPTPETTVRLDEITVSSTRTERRVDNVPNTVTVITAEKAEQEGARDIKDLFRNELGVDVRSAPTRFSAAGAATGRAGNEGINIRGLEGNQVLMTIDGIRVPNAFTFSSFSTGRGDYLDVDAIRSADVLRGPASTQFGSDGLAGAVSFRTTEPSDLLRGRDAAGFVRAGVAGVDESWHATMGAAARSGAWQGLVQVTKRKGHEVDNQGRNEALNASRTAPNPLDYNNRSVLAKAQYSASAAHQFGVTLETQDRKQDTEVYSARAVPPLTGTSAIDLDTHDRIARDRVSFEHRYSDLNAPLVQRAETRIFRQEAKVSQLSLEDRNTAADRSRNNTYRQDIFGLSTQLETNLSGSVNQRLSYGGDWSKTKVSGVRDGTVPPFGETFPTRPFPDTDYTLGGAFLQDEIEAGELSVIPGLRYDRYKLSPSAKGYTGALATLSDNALTPRIGVVWRATPALAPYAQWSKGFRAPTPDQVNNGFTNLASGYTSIGNPNLKAERANSFEIGLRAKFGAVRASLAAFDNSYDDFISQQVVRGAGTPADPLVFQYINLAKATIRGVEGRAEWRIDPSWQINGGFAVARGDSEAEGEKTPLDTVAPTRVTLGARYDAATWSARLNLQHNAAKDKDRLPAGLFAPGSSTVADLGLSWRPQTNISVNVNLNNVFDSTYWRWSDVRGVADNSTVKDAYTAPGRNLQASVRYDF
ncbi:TonB-dependent hemoglobin/transferrin/lactoferrin family receptor [Massilia sp. SR12]